MFFSYGKVLGISCMKNDVYLTPGNMFIILKKKNI